MEFRPLKPEDKEAALAIAAETWDGEDYIHLIWDEWMNEEDGEFTAILSNGELVGYGKFTLLGPGEVWLHGARIKKERRGEGIGSALLEYFLDKAQKDGMEVVRYAAHASNDASIGMGLNRGASIAGKYHLFSRPLTAPTPEAKTVPHQVAEITPQVIEDIQRCPFIKYGSGFMASNWQIRKVGRHSLEQYLEKGEIYAMHRGYILYTPPSSPKDFAYISAISGSLEVQNLLLNWALNQSKKQKAGSVMVKIPSYPPLIQFFRRRGFLPWGKATEPDFLLLEFKLS